MTDLTELADLPDLSDVARPPGHWIWSGRLALRSMMRRFEIHVHDADLMPRHGPVILASNHMGYLDGPLLFLVAPRPVHALVKDTMFDGRLGPVLQRLGQIPVNRREVDPLAVKRCLKVLSVGGVVAIYPEGERGMGDVSRTKPGAAYLALVTGAPVMPVACLGTRAHEAATNSMPKRGSRLDTVFGAPMRFDPVPWPRRKYQVASVQAEIQQALAAHVQSACEMTGQALPALPLKG